MQRVRTENAISILFLCDRDCEAPSVLLVRNQHDPAEFGFVSFLHNEGIVDGEARDTLISEMEDDAYSDLRVQVHQLQSTRRKAMADWLMLTC